MTSNVNGYVGDYIYPTGTGDLSTWVYSGIWKQTIEELNCLANLLNCKGLSISNIDTINRMIQEGLEKLR